ncbi:MAG: protein phosphatase 2C domain-containing protein [Halioglobus sp.]
MSERTDERRMSEPTVNVAVRAVGYTDIGQRSHNEDFFLVNEDIGLMMVADGVGGHQAGEVASALTCQVLEREVAAGASLAKGIKAANHEVFQAVVQELGRPGMATTVVALLFDGSAWDLAWVGDSRAYLWDGQLGLLSRDHSLVANLMHSGQISLEESRIHPKKNVIDQAIGLQGEDTLRIGSNAGVLQPGQTLLLCSDGLNDVLDSAGIVEILAAKGSLEERCKALVMAAVAQGGRDNTTVVLLEALEGESGYSEGVRPHFVWRYNPADKSYSGLPALRSAPDRNAKNVAPVVPEGTVMMKSPLASGAELSDGGKRRVRRRRHLTMFGSVLGLAVVAALIALWA